MDNNFYDYNRETRQRNTANQEKGIMTKIIIIQLVLSLCVTGIIFSVCRTDSQLSQNIKIFYGTICEKDMSVAEIFSVFKKVAQTTFAPSVQEETTEEINNEITGENETFSPVYSLEKDEVSIIWS